MPDALGDKTVLKPIWWPLHPQLSHKRLNTAQTVSRLEAI